MFKKCVLFIGLAIPVVASSQSILDRVKRKVMNKAEQRADQKVDKAIDKGLDKAEDAAKSKPGAKKDPPAVKTPADGGGSATEPMNTSQVADSSPGLKSFSRFDFIPGDQVVYAESFEQDVIGEMPTGWNTNGSGEVVSLNNYPGKWLKLFQQSIYLTSNKKSFGENYTIEFDMILELKSLGWFYPSVSFGMLATQDQPTTDNEFLKWPRKHGSVELLINPADKGNSSLEVHSYLTNAESFKGAEKTVKTLNDYYGKPVHIALQVQKERLRCWIGGDKVFDAPKAVMLGLAMNQLFIKVHPSNYNEQQYGIFVTNLKIAKGIPDTRHKLIDEGKFSTTGILFDVNSDVIKPESYGVLKEIATVLKDNPEVQVKIVGHTDADGEDRSNLELSKKRSLAVKNALSATFGVDAAKLQTDGKGESVPVGDNKTKEGKALNRRVEFLKL